MLIQVGTSGYSYAAWKGKFYPEDLPAARMLQFYAERFRTVEINNTFYRMPSAKTLSGWAGQTPERFTFVLKAPRRITHERRLKDVGDSLAFLVQTAAELGPKLGPLLFQLPPFLKKDVPRLADFLTTLAALSAHGKPVQAALEFRHDSWFDDEVYATLRAHGAALCIAQSDEIDTPLVATADWGYLRLRRSDYDEGSLATWARRILGQPWQRAHVFFKHEDEAKGPALAAALIPLLSGLGGLSG